MAVNTKVGLFWICDADAWLEQVAAMLVGQVSQPALKIICFARQARGALQAFPAVSGAWPYATINALVDVYDMASAQGLDFAIISFGRGIPIDLALLQQLLASPALHGCVWSMRIAEISAVGLLNSPRLPFVDDHFIIMNVRNAQEREFFKRKLIYASHFSSVGRRHAELASMIEYALGRDELHNHFVAQASRNQYGLVTGLNPLPFHLCESSGFLTCYPEFKLSLTELLERNLRRLQSSPEDPQTLRYALKRGYWYYRFEPMRKKMVSAISRVTFDIGKFQFQKRYDQESN